MTPFGIYLLRQFFVSLPVELEEAALIDGAGRLRILRSILLPLMGPPLSTRGGADVPVGLERLPVAAGRDRRRPDDMTVQLGLATFQSAHFTNWPVLMAGTLLSQLPVLLAFLFGQRYFVRSIASTAVEGMSASHARARVTQGLPGGDGARRRRPVAGAWRSGEFVVLLGPSGCGKSTRCG